MLLSDTAHLSSRERESLQVQLKERDEKHTAELKKEQAEVARLKEELKIRAEEKDRQEAELRNCQGELGRTKESLTTTSQVLKDLQAEAECWKTVLTKINAELSSKFFFCLVSLSFCLPTENFPHTDHLADNLVRKVRT